MLRVQGLQMPAVLPFPAKIPGQCAAGGNPHDQIGCKANGTVHHYDHPQETVVAARQSEGFNGHPHGQHNAEQVPAGNVSGFYGNRAAARVAGPRQQNAVHVKRHYEPSNGCQVAAWARCAAVASGMAVEVRQCCNDDACCHGSCPPETRWHGRRDGRRRIQCRRKCHGCVMNSDKWRRKQTNLTRLWWRVRGSVRCGEYGVNHGDCRRRNDGSNRRVGARHSGARIHQPQGLAPKQFVRQLIQFAARGHVLHIHHILRIGNGPDCYRHRHCWFADCEEVVVNYATI